MPRVRYEMFQNVPWTINRHESEKNAVASTQEAILCTLMDIRGELRRIRSIAECHNTKRIPVILDQINKNTRKRNRRKPSGRSKK